MRSSRVERTHRGHPEAAQDLNTPETPIDEDGRSRATPRRRWSESWRDARLLTRIATFLLVRPRLHLDYRTAAIRCEDAPAHTQAILLVATGGHRGQARA